MNNSYRSVWRTDSALRQYMYFLVMSQHTLHYDMNINELRQCCFDSGASLTGFVLQPVSLISMVSVVQLSYEYHLCRIKYGVTLSDSWIFNV